MKAKHETFRNFWGWPKGWNEHNLYTNTLSFWPIYHQRSTNSPPTINVQRIRRVPAAISAEISANSQSICRPSLGRYLGWHISRYVDRHIDQHSTDMSRDISVGTRLICQPIHRSSVGRYVDRYVSWGVHKIHLIHIFLAVFFYYAKGVCFPWTCKGMLFYWGQLSRRQNWNTTDHGTFKIFQHPSPLPGMVPVRKFCKRANKILNPSDANFGGVNTKN